MAAKEAYALAADVGGTHVKIALARFEDDRSTLIAQHVYPSRNYASPERVLEAFLAEPEVHAHASAIGGVCVAVAGPVEEGRARLTILPWQIDEAQLARHLGYRRV